MKLYDPLWTELGTPSYSQIKDQMTEQFIGAPLQRRAGWAEHHGELPVVEGTLVRLVVDRLPGDRHPKPVWLWASATGLVG